MSDPALETDNDPFEPVYTSGIVEEETPARELLPRAAPAEPFALHGCVLTPERAIEDGYVVVGAGNSIAAVQEQRPDLARVHDTNGVILPGLLDLHGHPEFNIFAAWEPPQLFANRYRWRASPIYKQVVREPWRRLMEPPSLKWAATRYAEIRALVGGATAIQGATPQYPKEEALVRNVDRRIFGKHKARSLIDLPSSGSRDFPDLQRILQLIAAKEVTAFYLHLAEGRAGDGRSVGEFDRLTEIGALTPATVIIHGTALTREQLGQVKDAGAKLVWSPQSNLRLYAETTRARDAFELGIPVGLGADWLPSGSTSLLAELKVARRTLARQGAQVSAQRLVNMVTRDAALIAGLQDQIGSIEPGRAADILVLERREEDPWENVVEADPCWVELVMIDGDLAYGRADWIEALAQPDAVGKTEPVLAWGKPMLLDTSYAVSPSVPQPRLAEIRAALIERYPQIGPIFA
jgi:5-methylthioadenosine/S-adenosylhomocysteine deaminase